MKTIIMLLLALTIAEFSNADVPQCAKILIKIETNDGRIIEGFYYYYGLYSFELFGYNPDSVSFQKIIDLLKRNEYRDTIEIYRNIIKLNNIKCGQANSYACLLKDVIKLNYRDIKFFNQIKIYPCHPEDSINNYYPAGCPPEIITELTNREIELINSTQNSVLFKLEDIEYFYDQLCAPVIVSYNPIMNQDTIIKFIKQFVENKEYSDQVYMLLKKELSAKDIIMFRTYLYN